MTPAGHLTYHAAPVTNSRPLRLLRPLLGVALVVCALAASRAEAREYSTDIRVSDEQELSELYYDGAIDEEEYRILLSLLEVPVDLNRSEKSDLYQLPGITAAMADAIVEERTVDGPYVALPDLMTRVDGVTWRLIAQIEPFVIVSLPKGSMPAARGEISFFLYKEFDGCEEIENDYAARSKYPCQAGYGNWPALVLAGRGEVMGWLDFGIVGGLHEGPKVAEFEPASRDVFASYGSPLFEPHSGWVRVRRPNGSAVIGSYHADYGQGLVMATSGRDRHGFRVRLVRGDSGSERISQHKGLFGAAAHAYELRVGRAQFDMSVFGSIRNYDLYSSYMKLTGGQSVDLMTDDLDSPRIWIDEYRARSLTLPDVFRVALAGGNVSVRFNSRTHIGVTGYGAFLDKTAMRGVTEQDTWAISRGWPTDTGWGVIGFDGGVGFSWVDFSGEAAFYLARDPAMALYFQARIEPAWGEFVFSARHYDIGYQNPFARGEANADQILGFTDRGEQGLRAKASYRHPSKRLAATGRVDFSHNLLVDTFDLDLRASVTGRPLEFLQLKSWFRFTDQNVALSGREHKYSGDLDESLFAGADYTGNLSRLDDDLLEEVLEELSERAGQKVTLGGQVRVDHKKIGDVTVRYQRTWTDLDKTLEMTSSSCQVRMQQGHAVRVSGRVTPTKTTTIKGSFRYYNVDVQGGRSGSGGTYGDHALYGSLQVEQKVAQRVKFRLRGLLGRRLADPPSACDVGSASRSVPDPAAVDEYDPTDHQLRHFGELLFTVQVKL